VRAACLAALLLAAAPAMAEFTFKRVKPPEAGTTRRITIQVEPLPEVEPVLSHNPEVAPALPALASVPGLPYTGGDTAEWFWSELSPALADAAPARELAAGAVLERKSQEAAGLAQSPDRLQRILDRHGAEILMASTGAQVSPALVLSVIAVESGGNAGAVSKAGASGLMQLMPGTAARFGVTDRLDPAQNISGGVQYLEWLLDEFNGDVVLALAGYNAGEGAVQRNGGVPPYAETRLYVPKVLAAWQTARGMCITPPERVTDGCIFAGLKVAAR
jgi:soluble lytic murein transglycosylase-like protein